MLSLIKKYQLAIAVIAWFVMTTLLYVIYQQQQLSVFDANKMMHSQQWQAKLSTHLQSFKVNQNQATLFVFSQATCKCAQRAALHIKELANLAAAQQVNFQHLQLSQLDTVQLPATPMAVLLSTDNELVYAGPLSSGLACSRGSGYVEIAMQNLSHGFNSHLNLTDTVGCYCS